jgi:XTP/dITP diphosphohydrolase
MPSGVVRGSPRRSNVPADACLGYLPMITSSGAVWQELGQIQGSGGRFVRKLLVATHNQGKVREYRDLLAGLPLEVTYLDAESIRFEVDETGSTFEKNAILKATAYASASGLWTWADDSGLEVAALGGAPGVYSARYAGDGASDADRYRKLLDALAGVPWDRRSARFCCVVALMTPPDKTYTTHGECAGIIAFGPAGSNGFGFDPVFYLPEHGCTMAQLAPEVKNQISHRARAAAEAAETLRRLLTEST